MTTVNESPAKNKNNCHKWIGQAGRPGPFARSGNANKHVTLAPSKPIKHVTKD